MLKRALIFILICSSLYCYTVQIPYELGIVTATVNEPDSAMFDYGAPIVVSFPGGFELGSLNSDRDITNLGCIYVAFLLAGGGHDELVTSGPMDSRGVNSYKAGAAVMAYCNGDITDTGGGSITDSLSIEKCGIIGMFAGSNGGNIAVPTLGMFGADFSRCDFLVTWESPTNDQIVFSDLGIKSQDENPDCDGIDMYDFTEDDCINTAFTGYGPIECHLDYTNLAYDSIFMISTTISGSSSVIPKRGTAFFDNDHNGRVTINGSGHLDFNEDCTYNLNEDFVLKPLYAIGPETGWESKFIFTFPVTRELWLRNILDTLDWPDSLATPDEAKRFWAARTSVFWYDSISRYFPDLEIILLGTQMDHVQARGDHPHIHQAFEGFSRNDFWVRINPDSSYLYPLEGHLIEPYTVNAPNTAPTDWRDIKPLLAGESVRSLVPAAIWELCDRRRESIYEYIPSDIELSIIASPNPFNSVCNIQFSENINQVTIVDIFGNIVDKFNTNQHNILWSPKELPSGIYFFTNEDKTISSKVMYIK